MVAGIALCFAGAGCSSAPEVVRQHVVMFNEGGTPLTPLDRTVGKFTSLMQSAHHVPPELRSRIHFKVFSYGLETAGRNPQAHGDFDSFPFWREAFYTPRAALPSDAGSPLRLNP